ncbi:uncharacterized protein PRCAT00001563001 [Priceomyces carsonii]|uniref:uncharacterized protein n=1 Tax=Priceomyces carsonii TaxID=28549 RepID=UPI002EDB82DD|nr:unnamed protein product [Priceomyces carsonii]
MKFVSVIGALSVLSLVNSETYYVTNTFVKTVYGGVSEATTAGGEQTVVSEAPTQKKAATSQTLSSSSTQVPTTLVSSSSVSSAETSPVGTSTESESSSTSVSGSDKSFASAILEAHNEKRAKHGADALTWDDTVYQYAQDYADKYDCSGSLKHSGGKYGENLAVGYSDGPSALDAWYDEGKNYDYSSASSFDHFTQVIWKGSSQLGCAYKDCSSENWGKYIICSYSAAGNVVGQGKKNLSSD